ncbi:GNAT family N-acetyltransferase [Solihabitans fulvus]|uniref:GNAT family N-acetyltransferase n=1 Tax=Solihabitans fulvus TaxID=1892852 RepID=A0A5B2WNQ0_9PSEU|nr:GNAT family N-acetyltransferase [Solihabitans fulvus]KAA2253623.1 GNAT family N-acetyltransferase [Solihabitans fulvus]
MHHIRFAEQGDADAVLALLARLQADPAHHIGYHGVTVEELTEELAEFKPDWAANAVLATDESGRLAGVLSVDVNPDLGRAWLYGPYVDVPVNHPAGSRIWDQTADSLYAAAQRLPAMAGIADVELYGHVEHRRMAAFAKRHGFPAGKPSSIFVLDGANLRTLLVHETAAESGLETRTLPTDPAIHEAVAVLHERCFPNTYLTGRQLVEGDHTVVVALRDNKVLGYAGGKVQQDEYFVDFVAVEPDNRGGGIGRLLVTELVWQLAARHGARQQAAAAIAGTNEASRRMFTKLGFHVHLELVSYRRRPEAETS